MRLLNNLFYIQNLQPTIRDIYGTKRNLNGYNVFLRYYFNCFKSLTEEDRKELLCRLGIHSMEMYLLSEEDSVVSAPEVCTTDTIKAAAMAWKELSLEARNAWKVVALRINNLPIIGAFESLPSVVTDQEVKHAMSADHNKFITTIHNILRKKKISIQDSTVTKRFGKEQVVVGAQVYKLFFISHLLKICFFGYNYSLLTRRRIGEIVDRKKKSLVIHIKSMEILVKLFHINGVSAFGYEDQDGFFYSFAGKVVLKSTKTSKEAIGYIIDEKKVLLETGGVINLESIYLPEFVKEDGCWIYHCNDEVQNPYIVTDFHPIRMKIFDSGNCQILCSRVVLSNDKSKLNLNM